MDIHLSPDQFDILAALVAGDVLFPRGERWYMSSAARPRSEKRSTVTKERRRQVKKGAVTELIQRDLIAPQPGNYYVTDLGLELLIEAQERLTADLTASLDDTDTTGDES